MPLEQSAYRCGAQEQNFGTRIANAIIVAASVTVMEAAYHEKRNEALRRCEAGRNRIGGTRKRVYAMHPTTKRMTTRQIAAMKREDHAWILHVDIAKKKKARLEVAAC